MRYAQGGGLTAESRRRRELVRLEAPRGFEQRVPSAVIAAELRVSERPVRRWRRTWQASGPAGLGHVSIAGLACYRASHRSRLICRLHRYRGCKGETKAGPRRGPGGPHGGPAGVAA